jgi:hypothetical protein
MYPSLLNPHLGVDTPAEADSLDSVIEKLNRSIEYLHNNTFLFEKSSELERHAYFTNLANGTRSWMQFALSRSPATAEQHANFCKAMDEIIDFARKNLASPTEPMRHLIAVKGTFMQSSHVVTEDAADTVLDDDAATNDPTPAENELIDYEYARTQGLTRAQANLQRVSTMMLRSALYAIYESSLPIDTDVKDSEHECLYKNFCETFEVAVESGIVNVDRVAELDGTDPRRRVLDKCIERAMYVLASINDVTLTDDEKHEIVKEASNEVATATRAEVLSIITKIKNDTVKELVDEEARNADIRKQIADAEKEIKAKTVAEPEDDVDNPAEEVNNEADDPDSQPATTETPSLDMIVNADIDNLYVSLMLLSGTSCISEAVDEVVCTRYKKHSQRVRAAYANYLQDRFIKLALCEDEPPADRYRAAAESITEDSLLSNPNKFPTPESRELFIQNIISNLESAHAVKLQTVSRYAGLYEDVKDDSVYRERAEKIAKARENEGREFESDDAREEFIEKLVAAMKQADQDRANGKTESTILVTPEMTQSLPPNDELASYAEKNREYYNIRYGKRASKVLAGRLWAAHYLKEGGYVAAHAYADKAIDVPEAEVDDTAEMNLKLLQNQITYEQYIDIVSGKTAREQEPSLTVLVGSIVSKTLHADNRKLLEYVEPFRKHARRGTFNPVMLCTLSTVTFIRTLNEFGVADIDFDTIKKLLTS